MKILLVGNYVEDGQFSMLGFSGVMATGLTSLGFDVVTIAPTRRFPSPVAQLRKWSAYADKYLLFPRALRNAARRADVVHVLDQGNGIYVNHLQRVRHVVTCHDLLAIRAARGELDYWHTGRSGQIYQSLILKGLRRSQYVACVSDATFRDAKRLLELPGENIRVIRNGPYRRWTRRNGEAPPAALVSAVPNPSRYLMHVGNAGAYKNRIAALSIFREVADRGRAEALVLAGEPLNRAELAVAERLGITSRLVQVNRPDDTSLEWLYSNAVALLVTSHDEGFGLPILEAQSCHCLVCVPDKEPMSQIAGPSGIVIDPQDPRQSAQNLIVALPTADERRAIGFSNLDHWSLDAMISAYAGAYTEIVESRHP